jgi:hypothetical protein
MKCYYTIDPKTLKKVFIPMCFGTIHTHDMDDCTCQEPTTEYQFQKERFNKVVEDKNKTIISQQNEIKHLNKIINSLKLSL